MIKKLFIFIGITFFIVIIAIGILITPIFALEILKFYQELQEMYPNSYIELDAQNPGIIMVISGMIGIFCFLIVITLDKKKAIDDLELENEVTYD